MKLIKILLIVLVLFGFMMAQDKEETVPETPTVVVYDDYENSLLTRYKLVNNELDKLVIEKAQIEYAFRTYQTSKEVVVEEPVDEDEKKE